jgi:predicted nucleic acid-binding protein
MHVAATPALYHRALDIKARYRFGFYDSLIVAGALAAGCRRLVSEDLQHGQRIEDLEVHDPFRV